jgi:hypothetical protein
MPFISSIANGSSRAYGQRTGKAFVDASGGTVTTYTSGAETWRVHTFTSSSTFTITKGGEGVRYLVVGGGGPGSGWYGGGGGAGGYITGTTTVIPGSTPIVVGSGGGGTNNNATFPGSASSALGFTGWEGGNGSGLWGGNSATSRQGGSGGGGSAEIGPSAGYLGQGNAGGNTNGNANGGGGGGAGGVGVTQLLFTIVFVSKVTAPFRANNCP